MKEEKAGGLGMGMMKGMMEGMGGMPDMWMTMAQKVTGSVAETSTMATYATPEVRGLFEEWAKAVEEEILAFLKEKGKANPSDISAKLSISEESALFFIGKMAREGKITLGEIRIGK